MEGLHKVCSWPSETEGCTTALPYKTGLLLSP
uniref:Uncharacterized protein n=1 Tax=Anguilla anguilla TaxID=7936 RepID=A0A0E9VQA5_ANGAN